jgi:hypothetical protein
VEDKLSFLFTHTLGLYRQNGLAESASTAKNYFKILEENRKIMFLNLQIFASSLLQSEQKKMHAFNCETELSKILTVRKIYLACS